MERTGLRELAIEIPKNAEVGLAEACCLFQHRVEHRREVAGRRIDDPQHLGSRGLLLQCVLLLGYEADILDRNHRLISESGDEVNLSVGKRQHWFPQQGHNPNHDPVTQQRHAEHGSGATELGHGQSELRIGHDVGDMNDPRLKHGTSGHGPAVHCHQPIAEERVVFRSSGVIVGGNSVAIALAEGDSTPIRIAEPCGSFQQRLQHRLQIEGRAADDLQHVADCGLIFQRFLQIPGALPQFAKQPRVLHRDHRLRGEILHQRDLLVGERPDFRARGGDHAEQHIVLAQRHIKTRTHTLEFERRPDHRMVDLRQVGKVNEAGAVDQRSGDRIVGAAVPLPQLFLERARIGVCRHRAESLAIAQHQAAMGHTTEPVRLLQYRIENRRKITERRIDDLQHIGGRGLLLQGFALLRQQPRVLHRDHRLLGEVLHERDLPGPRTAGPAGGRC